MIRWQRWASKDNFAFKCALDILYYKKWITEDTAYSPEEKKYFINQRLKRLDND